MNVRKVKALQWIFAGTTFLLAMAAFLKPFIGQTPVISYVGTLLLLAAIVQIVFGFRCSTAHGRTIVWVNAGISLYIAVLLLNASVFAGLALAFLVALSFAIDAYNSYKVFKADRQAGKHNQTALMAVTANVLVVLLFLLYRGRSAEHLVILAGSLRILGAGFTILRSRTGFTEEAGEDVLDAMGMRDNPKLLKLVNRIEEQEDIRVPIDRAWIVTLLIVLLAIHISRMGFDTTFSGIVSPLLAMAGDIAVALIITYAILSPLRSIFRGVTQPVEKLALNFLLNEERDPLKSRNPFKRIPAEWIQFRLRTAVRLRKAAYSLRTAFRTGLQIGLPFSAILAATAPIFGMSWYFDTENWAAGVWDRWSAANSDRWRMAMVRSIDPQPGASSFRVQPEGISDTSVFSFIVVGDPGEGDNSQLVLKDEILKQSSKPQVKFLVVSSDVVYPTGAIRHYESNFWMPFKGLDVPIYAIPGNHDWYDALNGFASVFFTPEAARKSINARMKSDGAFSLSPVRDSDINEMLSWSESMRLHYELKTGYQESVFFQVSSDSFLLICLDTGVLRQLDSLQLGWLRNVLEKNRNKQIMVLLGHPFYAIGEYQGGLNPAFAELHELLRKYPVRVCMGGDTHDFEFYEEASEKQSILHFVNGGGGAYLSMGASFRDTAEMPVGVWAHYPSKQDLSGKIEDLCPWWKRPAWWWLKKYQGWPLSAEFLSAAFDYNQAPWFQSFMEVEVDPVNRFIRLIPYTASGQMKLSDLQSSMRNSEFMRVSNGRVEWKIPFN